MKKQRKISGTGAHWLSNDLRQPDMNSTKNINEKITNMPLNYGLLSYQISNLLENNVAARSFDSLFPSN